MKLLMFTLLSVLLAGCVASGVTTALPDARSSVVQIYTAYCGACHGVPHPGRHRAAEWPIIVQLMEGHMQRRGMEPPQENERQAILRYLQEHAR